MKREEIVNKMRGLIENTAKKVTLNTVGKSTPWDFYEPEISESLKAWADQQSSEK